MGFSFFFNNDPLSFLKGSFYFMLILLSPNTLKTLISFIEEYLHERRLPILYSKMRTSLDPLPEKMGPLGLNTR